LTGPVRSRAQAFERSINIVQKRLNLVRTVKVRLGHESDSTLAMPNDGASALPTGDANDPARSRTEVQECGVSEAPNVDVDERSVGVVNVEMLWRGLDGPKDLKIEDTINSTVTPVHQSVHLHVVLETLTSTSQTWAAVIDDDQHVIGTISISDIVRHYRPTLQAHLRRVSEFGGSTRISEIQMSDDFSLVGETAHSTSLPRSGPITAVERGRGVIRLTGDTVFSAGDRLIVLGVANDLAALSELASSKRS